MKNRKFNVDRRWFMARIAERHITQSRVAEFLGVDPGAITLWLQGERALRITEATKIAKLLGVALAEVLTHSGLGAASERTRVKVRGHINAEGIVSHVASGAEDEIDGPRDMPPTAYALQARTHNTPFGALDRWTFFISGAQQSIPSLMGQLALVATKDGKERIALLKEGYKGGLVNLEVGPHTLHDVQIIWAMRVLWAKPFYSTVDPHNGHQ